MTDLLDRYTNKDELLLLIENNSAASWQLDTEQVQTILESRVRGQEHVIEDLVQVISRQFAKVSRRRPVANLMFVGPSGTGKGELCKALAEALYGDENNRIEFDCGQFKDPSAISRLVGSAQGYQGGTGELTKAMMANKKRIVVFDEIEKAHESVFDLFLSIMGEGRLQDQRTGKAADFTEAIVILTSNAEQDSLSRLTEQTEDPSELNNAVRVHLRETGTFRPEIIGRIDRIYVFRQLQGIVRAEIVVMKIRKLALEYDLEVEFVDPQIVHELLIEGDKLSDFGARQREQVVEDRLAGPLSDAKRRGATRISLSLDSDGDLLIAPA